MAQTEAINSIVCRFLRSHQERLLDVAEVITTQEIEGLTSFSCVMRGIRRSYRLFISVERQEPGYEIQFLAELLRPESLSEQIDEKGTEFFSTMVRRLNEPYPGEPFAFDAGHPSLLCSALADGLSEDAITEDLLNGLFAAIRYLVRHYEKHLDTLLLEMTSNPYPEGFKCRQCGHCCMNLEAHYMSVPQADVDRWRKPQGSTFSNGW